MSKRAAGKEQRQKAGSAGTDSEDEQSDEAYDADGQISHSIFLYVAQMLCRWMCLTERRRKVLICRCLRGSDEID
jgi:hypothetical protein